MWSDLDSLGDGHILLYTEFNGRTNDKHSKFLNQSNVTAGIILLITFS